MDNIIFDDEKKCMYILDSEMDKYYDKYKWGDFWIGMPIRPFGLMKLPLHNEYEIIKKMVRG